MNELVPLAPSQSQPQLTGQADTDGEVISLWLFGRSAHTQRAYRHDICRFLAFTGLPLARVTLRHLQAFSDSLANLSDGSRARCLAAVKSLLTFAQKIGY